MKKHVKQQDLQRGAARAGYVCLYLLLLAGFILLAYGQSLSHRFAWDDYGLIVDNDQIKVASGWLRSFARNFWDLGENAKDPTRSFYRPVIVLSYVIDHAIWKMNPFGYHLTNIVAHMLCSFTVFLVMLKLAGNPHYAAIGALVWAINPTHVENIAWISGRTDIFSGVFYFPALYFCIRALETPRQRRTFFLLSALLYLAALMSKEMALSFMPVAALFCFVYVKRPFSARVVAFPSLLYAIVTVGYLSARIAVLGQIAGPPVFGSLMERFMSIPMVFAKYLGLLLNLVPVDPHHAEGFLHAGRAAAGVLYLLLATVFLILAVWAIRRGNRLTGFGMLWFVITLLPVFNLGTFGDVLYADRFLYIPSFGLALIIPAIMTESRSRILSLRVVQMGLGLWLLFYLISSLTLSRLHTAYWEDSTTLFTHAAGTSPNSAYIHYNLGYSLADKGRHEEALAALQRAIILQPNYPQAYVRLGISLNALQQYEAALHYFRKALRYGYFSDVIYNHIGITYMNLEKLEQAKRFYGKALALRETAEYHNNLGECLLGLKEYKQAAKHFLKGLNMEPSPAIYNNLAILAAEEENYSDACAYLERALQFPSEALTTDTALVIHYNLARFLSLQNKPEEARLNAMAAKSLLNDAGNGKNSGSLILRELEKILESQ
ncbi:MAG TPA: tetratricopeptide repeat protein [Kiritimatiellia bacterium]|mgnify:CR=1 FL=1|nr:tetratricopeptide repeat protein [Kiritimatiellia bacterium]HNS79980.1 tetratricopeptide repeat protein [Kiritimatiellia bacterium]HQQ03372.1 tetratricopeptide repeat protein [Kiritimatiellia bacterium]